MNKELMNADIAFSELRLNKDGVPLTQTTPFVCAYSDCGAFASHIWGSVIDVASMYSTRKHAGPRAVSALCLSCQRETLRVEGQIVWPIQLSAPAPVADMPDEVLADFEEARRIHTLSPRGAAALLRLVVQKLCPILGSEKKDINRAIGELVENGIITSALQKALDTVRVVGNEAVHPGELDLKDDAETVHSLFVLINFIVEKAITEPKRIAEIYGGLPPKKLEGIEARDREKT